MKIASFRFVLPAFLLVGASCLIAGCPAPEETATDTAPTTTASVSAAETPAPAESTDTKIAGPPPPPGPAKNPSDFDKKPFKGNGKVVKTASGLQYEDMTVGKGATAEPGKQCIMHYTGTLKDGTKFDSSRDRGEPFPFPLGAGRVIKGWDEGVAGMKVGGRRKLTIPASIGYGDTGSPPVIPGGATLVFDVELMDVQDAPEGGMSPF